MITKKPKMIRKKPTKRKTGKTRSKKSAKPASVLKGKPIRFEREGNEVDGINADFDTEKDDWSVYRLSDGSRVKVRTIVSDIIVTNEQVKEGVPLIAVHHAVIVKYDAPKRG